MEFRDHQGLTEQEFLKSYDAGKFERPSVTVDTAIFTITSDDEVNKRNLSNQELQVLLIKRGGYPYLGQWALPGGFVNPKEDVDHAAVRELKEETNLDCSYMEQLYTWGEVNRDPRTRVISISYLALLDSTKFDIQAGDDASDAKWYTVKDTVLKKEKTLTEDGFIQQKWVRLELISDEVTLSAIIKIIKIVKGTTIEYRREVVEQTGIAFDHARIIQYSIERLRNKVDYTDIAFGLMPQRFTLSELQKVYEVILGKNLYKAQFRLKIEKMVNGTGEFQRGKAHKPAELFRFNPNWDEDDNF